MLVLNLLKGLMSIVSAIAEYARNKQLLDAGAAEAFMKGVQDANDAITKANTARNNSGSLPVDKDPNNRDN